MSIAASAAPDIQGYTPAQIRHAYGFDQINLGAGISADGRGQTIAIVDAFNHPNIVSDLQVFSDQFGLSRADLKVVNQTGGSSLPTTDAGWAGEIALDVEWAHAIAPAANILLVEANSASVADLMAGVNFARSVAEISVVSMSWGGSEFFSWGGGESQSQTNYDPIFTTPAGHQGVTFVASAGDSGSSGGVQWPASSPNVISVGGTSLYVQDSAGTYSGETGWGGTSGGFSQVENEPTYQQSVQQTGVRTTPDVSYAADPNTGFAVYDSIAYSGVNGWQEVGGTSAGAPQWAALIAIADEGRAQAGLGTLDGATQTLPSLYSVYAATDSAGQSLYDSTFQDVNSGGSSGYRWRWGGSGRGNQATPGYDLVTGLGSPRSAGVVKALVAAAGGTSAGAGSGSAGGSGSSSSTAAALPASPFSVIFRTFPETSVIAGDAGTVKLRLTNVSGSEFDGPVTITLYASTDGSISSDDTTVTTLSIPTVRLRAGHSKTVKVKFDYPTVAGAADEQFIASIEAPGTNTAAATAVSSTPVAIATPLVDLSTAFSKDAPVIVHEGHRQSLSVTIKNVGNVTAIGTLSVSLYGSTDSSLDASDALLATLSGKEVRLRPGKSLRLKLHFDAPAKLAANYNLIASATSAAQPADYNSSNNDAVIEAVNA